MPDDLGDGALDWEEEVSRIQDRWWSYVVTQAPFSWHLFLSWWIARRWIVPRDVRNR